MINAIAPEVQRSFQLSVNGEFLSIATETDDRPGLIYCGVLPQSLLALAPGRARLGIHVSHVRSFAQVEPTLSDQLPRGVALVEILVEEERAKR